VCIDWLWQFVFPAGRICRDERFGPPTRFHLHKSAVQRAVTEAGLAKRVGCHTFRHHADCLIMPTAFSSPQSGGAEIARLHIASSA
jgi:integrase